MDDRSLAELRALRARAYGPDADIQTDPAALARLRELERPAVLRPSGGSVVVEAARAVSADPAPPSAVAEAPPATSAPPPAAAVPTPRRRRGRGRLLAWWAASIAVTVVVTASIATAVDAPSAPVTGAHYYATIGRDESFVVPGFLQGAEAQIHGFRDYLGLTPIVVDGQLGPVGRHDCLMLAETRFLDASTSGFTGLLVEGCGAAPFPVALSFTVDGSLPEQFRETFPIGTVLQFEVVGDTVEVFKLTAPDPTPTTFSVECATCHGT